MVTRTMPADRSLLLLAIAPTLLGIAGYLRRWIAKDAFIDFRVVEMLLAGYGPVFNVDERVEAHTNPLWVALLAAWSAPTRTSSTPC